MSRILRILALLLVLATAIPAALVAWTLPGGDRTAAIPGLTAPVDIAIDPDGIPRIHAANEPDAAAALGFLHARERMFQMDLMRRAAAGELSELAGPQTLPLDRLVRTLGLRQSADSDLPSLPRETRAALDAYAAGVNAWIAARGRFSALEFLLFGAPRPWTPTDTLLWAKTMGLYLSGNWRAELARLGTDHAELAFPTPFTQPGSASDEWAVDAAHSTTGAPLLAGDPHLAFAMPAIWYLARIETPGQVLAGATAPGVPFLVMGHNNNIAWSFTTTGADVQDLFIETPAEGGYLAPNGPLPFKTRAETIHIRGQPDEILQVRETRHGPVISDLLAPDGPILAVAMANLAPNDTAALGLQSLNRAKTLSEAAKAAELLTSPVQNLLIADRSGIQLTTTGRIPIRAAGDGARPVQGADGTHDWTGWATGNRLPHASNPPEGRLLNGNERVAPADFPVFMGRDWPADWRARRIRTLLDAAPATTAHFTAMQVDPLSPLATAILPKLRAVRSSDPLARNALKLLADWDGTMAETLPQPLIFNAWTRRLHALLLRAPASAATQGMELVEQSLETGCPDCAALLQQSLSESLSDLATRFGPDPSAWRWGAAHQAVFAHPLLGRLPVVGPLVTARVPVPGDDATLFRGAMYAGSFDAVHGASYRGVYDLADLDRSRFVVAPGQSGHPLSRLAWNFLPRWHDGGSVTLGPAAEAAVRIRLVPG